MRDTGAARSSPSSLGWTPGGVSPGGNKIHFFLPETVAFQALVQLGSTWNDEPERAGPAMSQRWSGRCSSPSTESRSSWESRLTGGGFVNCLVAISITVYSVNPTQWSSQPSTQTRWRMMPPVRAGRGNFRGTERHKWSSVLWEDTQELPCSTWLSWV